MNHSDCSKRARRGADTMKTSVGKLFLCSLLLIFSGQSIVNKQKKQYIATDVILDAKFAKSNQNGVDTYGKSYEVFWSNPDFGYLHYSGAESCPMPIPTIPDRFCALSDYVSAKWGHLYPSWPEIRDAPKHLVGFTICVNSVGQIFQDFLWRDLDFRTSWCVSGWFYGGKGSEYSM